VESAFVGAQPGRTVLELESLYYCVLVIYILRVQGTAASYTKLFGCRAARVALVCLSPTASSDPPPSQSVSTPQIHNHACPVSTDSSAATEATPRPLSPPLSAELQTPMSADDLS
jgi:hypothetical protein